MRRFIYALLGLMAGCDAAEPVTSDTVTTGACAVELFVLGAGQDAGAPQIGNSDDAGWSRDELRLYPTSLALVDHRSGARYLFEATPAITEQMALLDTYLGTEGAGLRLNGVFLTHAHIGHYAGLMFLGREAAGARDVPVYAMPRMADFLRENGPWSQLVSLGNIEIRRLSNVESVQLAGGLRVTPYRVPHRDEYSETVGYMIGGPGRSVLFVPDIDSWAEWDSEFGVRIQDMVAAVDYAFLDATFFDDNELPGRDMSEIPHPRVTETMALFSDANAETRAKVHFIHYNHTNPIRNPQAEETRTVLVNGFKIARRGERICLSGDPG